MTANQAYKKYKSTGGELSFAEWMNRNKKKKFLNFQGEQVIPENKPLTDSINQILDQIHQDAGYQSTTTTKYILGIPRGVLIGVGVAIVIGTTGYILYKKYKK